jgi:hydroxymethylglutaryl-CoA reductase
MQKTRWWNLDIILKDKTDLLPNYFQLHATFETKDSMGANFINSCLEQFSKTLKQKHTLYVVHRNGKEIEVVMSILSNYVPNCIVRAEVS